MGISEATKDIMFNALEEVRIATEEHFQKEMNLPGFVYRDIPWTEVSAFQTLMNIIGVDEVKIIAMTAMHRGGADCRRGQFMISPKGMDNIRKYNEQNKKEAEDKESNGDSS